LAFDNFFWGRCLARRDVVVVGVTIHPGLFAVDLKVVFEVGENQPGLDIGQREDFGAKFSLANISALLLLSLSVSADFSDDGRQRFLRFRRQFALFVAR
jgi:hypothetical protein